MRLETQILLAVVLDLLVGDPRWLPHPVKFIGRFALAIEKPLRAAIANQRAAGVAAAAAVVCATALAAFALLRCAQAVHPLLGGAVSVLLIYSSFAARDLAAHSMRVFHALRDGDLSGARRWVSWMVGRDTDSLDEAGVVRAAVESVAENTVDGVTAPLFFAVLGGPVAALAYKAASTLDSTFGYKNERYILFGWASARLDDALNYLPARLTAPLIVLAAWALRLDAANAARMALRDGRKHPSPNSGIPEAAIAGALSVQLGGVMYRKGAPVAMPPLGEPDKRLEREMIRRTNAVMLLTSWLGAAFFLAARLAFLHFFGGGAR